MSIETDDDQSAHVIHAGLKRPLSSGDASPLAKVSL